MRYVLSILLTLGLFLTPGTRFAFGLPCPCCPAAIGEERASPTSGCACCAQEDDTRRNSSDRPVVPEKPSTPFQSTGIGWCCGGGFVPLTAASEAPAPELTPEPAFPLAGLRPPEGLRPRIEHPPRVHV